MGRLYRIRFAAVVSCWLAFLAPYATGEDATVTFYNHGSTWTSGLPGTNHGIYWGCIYDGNVRLNCFREQKVFSQIKNNRFAVYHFAPGVHVFSASYGKHPSKRSEFSIELDPGKHYYLRAQSESRGIVEIEWEYGRIDKVTCEVAQEETEKGKPLSDKVFSPEGRAARATVQTIPPCQQ
jgi:hypothetical protein